MCQFMGIAQGLYYLCKRPPPLLVGHRCGDTHRELIRAKDYVQVSLQRGMDRMTVTCPRSMQSELRRCITNRQEQGYNMLSLTEESI